jgi:hypothetical protein
LIPWGACYLEAAEATTPWLPTQQITNRFQVRVKVKPPLITVVGDLILWDPMAAMLCFLFVRLDPERKQPGLLWENTLRRTLRYPWTQKLESTGLKLQRGKLLTG